MTLIKLLLILPLVFISMTTQLSAQTITLEKFFEQLQKKHPIFEKERLTAQIEQEEQNSKLGTQDWNVFSM